MFSYHILENELVISYDDAIFNVSKDSITFDDILPLLRSKKYDDIRYLLDIEKRIEELSGEIFIVIDGAVYSYGKKVHEYISNKILYYYENDLPFENLILFWNNLINNNSKESVNELYKFLEYNKYPLTDDGCFVAYKKVTEDFYDFYTENIDNSIGSIVTMDVDEVCSDRNITCSTGLHVASYEYAKNFHGPGNGILIQVKVNPKDVVSVPYDYNNAKLRCCKYEVISAYNYKMKDDIYKTLKIGNYNYLVKRLRNDLLDDPLLTKRRPSAVPKALDNFNDLDLKKCFVKKSDIGYIEYYIQYINKKNKNIYFKFTRI